ncbi:hypothetical protein [Thermoplasma volcanium GSS1]|uniref:Ribonuclease P protein component 1 n=1 Tax=Thermoplasma volcanium (strain ATCC 51530 / DSM 4299 / JCM 9571 / NBRC 15438 / GSS1) TaxID=273116 RepID=RNP1_THEVO|nr:ribonuclease P protein component 1 [Thermoplasma volcanium]Q97BW8.1 RecName: Full=Ribonuclease P protein component 1; Short=RNase P component 1; AltName: Full=Rpp29 [Thermoplasma volcanium GSS1]BAB59479.1 hypothetical protein [Thermoplasma volcanium GSS1]
MIYISEFIGRHVEVIQSSNRYDVGISGQVSFETKNTFEITKGTGKVIVPKEGRIFTFDGKFKVDGSLINYRPEDRLREYRKILKKLGGN